MSNPSPAGASNATDLTSALRSIPQFTLPGSDLKVVCEDSSPTAAFAKGADIVLHYSSDNSPSISFHRHRPIIHLVPPKVDTDAASPRTTIRRTAEGVELRLHLIDKRGKPPKTAHQNFEEHFTRALRLTKSPLLFLENVSQGEDSEEIFIRLNLNRYGRVKTIHPISKKQSADWNNSDEFFIFDPEKQTNSLLIEHELKLQGVHPEWISSGFLIGDYQNSKIAYNVSSSHRTSQTAAKAVGEKQVARAILQTAGVSVADGFFLSHQDHFINASKLLELHGSVVVKPANGTKGKGVSVDVRTEDELKAAWDRAFAETKLGILVEQFFEGTEARFLVVGGECVAIARRVPPTIIGDGISTIQELIKTINARRRKNPHLYNRPVLLTPARIDRLVSEGLTPLSTLAEGQQYVIDRIGGFSTGAESMDITDEVHPSYKKAAIAAVQAIPGLAVSGVDLLVRDFSAPASPTNHIVVELNSQPGLGSHHFPAQGMPRNAAGKIVAADLEPRVTTTSDLVHLPQRKSTEYRESEYVKRISHAFETRGFEVAWLHPRYFISRRDNLVTNFWDAYTSLTSKAAVTATRHTRIACRLLRRDELPVPHGRIFPADRPGEFLQGAKALAYARSLGGRVTLRHSTLDPISVHPDNGDRFTTLWNRMTRTARHGILLERERRGQRLRFLVAYGHVINVMRETKNNDQELITEEIHSSYYATAQQAANAFPGLDISEVTMVVRDTRIPASDKNHRVFTVRANPDLKKFAESEESDQNSLADTIVEMHIIAIKSELG